MTQDDDSTLIGETSSTPKLTKGDVRTFRKWGPYVAAFVFFATGNGAQYGLTWAGFTDPSGAQAKIENVTPAVRHIVEVYKDRIKDLQDQRELDRERIAVLRNEIRECLWSDEETAPIDEFGEGYDHGS